MCLVPNYVLIYDTIYMNACCENAKYGVRKIKWLVMNFSSGINLTKYCYHFRVEGNLTRLMF